MLQMWEQGDAPRALALLEKYRPKPDEEDLRGFEWYYLWRRAKDQGRTLIGHLGAVHHVAASPDGRLVATAGADREDPALGYRDLENPHDAARSQKSGKLGHVRARQHADWPVPATTARSDFGM